MRSYEWTPGQKLTDFLTSGTIVSVVSYGINQFSNHPIIGEDIIANAISMGAAYLAGRNKRAGMFPIAFIAAASLAGQQIFVHHDAQVALAGSVGAIATYTAGRLARSRR